MVLVFLGVLESLVALVLKVFPASLMDTQEDPDRRASLETQACQAVLGWMELVEMMGSQEVQDTVQQRVFRVNLADRGSQAPLVSLDQRVFRDTPDPEEQTVDLEVRVGLEDLDLRVCPGHLVWMD